MGCIMTRGKAYFDRMPGKLDKSRRRQRRKYRPMREYFHRDSAPTKCRTQKRIAELAGCDPVHVRRAVDRGELDYVYDHCMSRWVVFNHRASWWISDVKRGKKSLDNDG